MPEGRTKQYISSLSETVTAVTSLIDEPPSSVTGAINICTPGKEKRQGVGT